MENEITKQIESIISEPVTDEKHILQQLKKVIRDAETQSSIERNSKSISDLCAETIQLIENHPSGDLFKTGFENYDNQFGGLSAGEFVVIGGRPAMGKTQMLVTMALHLSLNQPVLYYTYDLSETYLSYRFISGITAIPGTNLVQHKLADDEKSRLSTVESEMEKRQLFIMDGGKLNLYAFIEHCSKQIVEKGVKVVIIDYLQLMTASNNYRSRDSEISEIVREFKNIATNNNVCVIASSQLNRTVESRGGTRRPILSDLRDSGAIEQDADKVLFIYRPEYYGLDVFEDGNSTDCVIELILAKNRIGNTGSIHLLRDKSFTRIFSDEKYLKKLSFSDKRLEEFDMPF
jgi:replicative DNA helicase